MIIFPIIALILGILMVWFAKAPPLTGPTAPYFAIACLAGLDSVVGGYRSGLEGKFRTDVFFTGFVSNAAIALFIAFLGDRIGLNLNLVAALVLGQRIFINLSLIRRMLLTKWQDVRLRRKQREEQAASQAAASSANQPQTTP